MKTLFLHRRNAPRLILFFTGWGMDERPTAHLGPQGADVLFCYDYTEPPETAVLDELLRSYARVVLAAWSLGVWAAWEAFGGSTVKFEDALAINGTLRPVDSECGIPPDRFEQTASLWSEATRPRFYRRMCGDPAALAFFLNAAPRRSVEFQREELLAVGRRVAEKKMGENRLFHRAFIGRKDRVFPPAGQAEFWSEAGVATTEAAASHYVFAGLTSWREVFALGED